MISYEPFWQTLKEKGVSTYVLIKKHNISTTAVTNFFLNINHTLQSFLSIFMRVWYPVELRSARRINLSVAFPVPVENSCGLSRNVFNSRKSSISGNKTENPRHTAEGLLTFFSYIYAFLLLQTSSYVLR